MRNEMLPHVLTTNTVVHHSEQGCIKPLFTNVISFAVIQKSSRHGKNPDSTSKLIINFLSID